MRAFVIWALVVFAAGCGGGRPAPAVTPDAPRGGALERYIAEVRRLSIDVKPTPAVHPSSAEAQDPHLREALSGLGHGRTAEAHVIVAEQYRRLGILDAAFDQYEAALRVDRRSAAAHDGLARIMRDAGTPALGVANAVRATYFAPQSAEARNTFGTLLYALGHPNEAREAFAQALALDPRAAYAANNLCYVALTGGDLITARHHCRTALELSPGMRHATNNLATTLAAGGNMDEARAQFRRTGDDASTEFNLGVALAAVGRYREAAAAFETAVRLRPGWSAAATRAEQARRLQEGTPLHADR